MEEKLKLCGYRIIFRYGKPDDVSPIVRPYWNNKIYRDKPTAEEALKYITDSNILSCDMWQWFIVPVHSIPNLAPEKEDNGLVRYNENKDLRKYKVTK